MGVHLDQPLAGQGLPGGEEALCGAAAARPQDQTGHCWADIQRDAVIACGGNDSRVIRAGNLVWIPVDGAVPVSAAGVGPGDGTGAAWHGRGCQQNGG